MTAPHVRHRDQLVDALVVGRRRGLFRYHGQVSRGVYAVELDLPDGDTPLRREHDVAGMSAWLDGFGAGRALVDRAVVIAMGARAPEPVRTLLNCPSVADQRRIRVLHAMERRSWTIAAVAAQIHAQRSTVRDLLMLGYEPHRVTSSSRSIDEIEALLPELARGYGRKPSPIADRDGRVEALAEARKEPAELRKARALALAVEAGIVAGWTPHDVSELRSARVAQVVDIGSRTPAYSDTHTVRVSTLIEWVRGFADGTATAAEQQTAPEWPAEALRQVAMLARNLS